jgi:hypothetical protein
MEYPHSFFIAALEAVAEATKEDIINNAIAARGAKVEDFEAFVDSIRLSGRAKEVNHDANIAALKGRFK